AAGAAAGGLAQQIVEPAREVPEQFKGTIRRAHKQLLKHPDPKLLEAFNAFAAALNAGTAEDDLIDLGDELEDVYQECRLRAS
nr:hypothetical protein [Acidobacteriota bacterium]